MQNDKTLTIAEAARLIRARSISPVELTQGLLQRIERLAVATGIDCHRHSTNTGQYVIGMGGLNIR